MFAIWHFLILAWIRKNCVFTENLISLETEGIQDVLTCTVWKNDLSPRQSTGYLKSQNKLTSEQMMLEMQFQINRP